MLYEYSGTRVGLYTVQMRQKLLKILSKLMGHFETLHSPASHPVIGSVLLDVRYHNG
jgi:hypothetical protein